MIVFVATLVGLVMTSLMIAGARTNRALPLDGPYRFVRGQARYQSLALLTALVVVSTTQALGGRSAHRFLDVGEIDNPAHSIGLLGIREGERWSRVTVSGGIAFAAVTALYLVVQLRATRMRLEWTRLPRLALPIMAIATTNSLAEEMIFRLGVAAPLAERYSSETICVLSAVLFGLAHWRGLPRGLIGMAMASVLGYFLARATLETGGLGVAWALHFVLDVLIIGVAATSTPIPDDTSSAVAARLPQV